jgi:DNA polymerase-3 subunit delta'
MSWDDVLGHADQVENFRRSAVGGRLAHAYAFVGPAGIGKRRFALELAECLLCERHSDAELESCGQCPSCQQVKARTHPDLILISPPEGKSILPIKLIVGEDDTRGKEGLCHDLSLRPMSARRRVAIIDEADWMNDEAANALLKTLEEPPPASVLILIASGADGLLPTIRSRCQIVTFQPLPTSDVRKLLLQQELVTNETDAAQVAALSQGSLESARQLLDPQLRSLREELYDLLAAQPFRSVQTAGRMLECIEGAGSETSQKREFAGWVVRFCVEFYRHALLALAGDVSRAGGEIPQVRTFVARLGAASEETIDVLADLVDRCLDVEWQLEANAAIPLLIDSFFDDLGRILRRS